MIQVAMDCASSAGPGPSSGRETVISPAKLSPYSDIVALRFVDQVLYAPRFLLEKSPGLGAKASGHKEIDMSETSGTTGHVIVNYLYTDKYEDLDTALGPDEALRGSFEVYAAATIYQLGELRERAQEAIERHNDDVNAAEALAALKRACPLPDSKDLWLQAYTKKLSGAAYTGIASFLESDIMASEYAESTISVTEMILRAVISSAKEKAEQAAREEAAREEATRKAAAAEAKAAETAVRERDSMLVKLRCELSALDNKKILKGRLGWVDRQRLVKIKGQLDLVALQETASPERLEVRSSLTADDPEEVALNNSWPF